jgi:L-lysine 2,3-aminomutase
MVTTARPMKFYGINDIDSIPQLQHLSTEDRFAMKVVASVLPFRTNNYIVEELIDWNNVPDDSMYQLTFMQREMLQLEHYEQLAQALKQKVSRQTVSTLANTVRLQLNPHPSGQMTDNVPMLDDELVPGLQHKYRETCLIFP